VRLWEAESGRPLAVLEGHNGGVWSVGWSGDGLRVVSGGADGTVRLWEAESGRSLAVLEGHKGWVRSVGWSGDGRRVVSGGADGSVRLWEAESGQLLAVLEGHKGQVMSVSWSGDGRRILSGGVDGTVRVWDMLTGQQLVALECNTEPYPVSDETGYPKGHQILRWDVKQLIFRERLSEETSIEMALVPSHRVHDQIRAYKEVQIDAGKLHSLTPSPPQFLLSVHPINQKQWREVASWPSQGHALPSLPLAPKSDNLPATGITYDDAIEFCKRLAAQTGRYYELPTETQWEYASQAGSSTAFSWGNDYSHSLAAHTANAWGLRQMQDGIWEWCRTGLRGGPWDGLSNGRVASRRASSLGSIPLSSVGLRVCCLPIGTPYRQLESSRQQWRPPVSRSACEKALGCHLKKFHYADLLLGLRLFKILTLPRLRYFLSMLAAPPPPGVIDWINVATMANQFDPTIESGNSNPEDGEIYRSAGALHLSGRKQYTAFAQYIGDNEILKGASVVAELYPYSSAAFLWFMREANKLADMVASPEAFSSGIGISKAKHIRTIATAYQMVQICFPDPR
jgi:hypothetical protein